MEREPGHLSIETLARWLAGDLPHEVVVGEIAPHLEASCPTCRERFSQLRNLQEAVGHWSETVVLFEGREAPGQLARLERLALPEQLALVEAEENLRSWALCALLIRESQKAVFEQPIRAVERAEVAVRIAEQLSGEVYDSVWVHDLWARAWAHLANSRRVLGELLGADQALRTAFALLDRGGTGAPEVRGELLHIQAALRRAQRRMPEALAAADDAMALFLEANAASAMRRVRLTRAKIREELGDLAGTLAELENLIEEFDAIEASPSVDVETEAVWRAYAHINLLFALVADGQYDEAARRLAEVRGVLVLTGPIDRVRLRWLEARIAAGQGRQEEAENILREVREEFFERRMGYDAALAALELAVLFIEQGRTPEIKQLAIEVLPLFESREVHREAMGALILFQRAAEQEVLTVEMVRQVTSFLSQERSIGF
jgi:tetratricopeptide (TPR) repeat protein